MNDENRFAAELEKLGAKSFSDSSRSVCHNCPEKVEHVGSLSKLMK